MLFHILAERSSKAEIAACSAGSFRRIRIRSVQRSDCRAYLIDRALWAYLLMPNLLILDSSVCRGILSLAAAPLGPPICPCDSANAAVIISTSRSANARSPAGAIDDSRGLRLNHISSTENVSPSLRITPRSTTFCNSRMFPGQSYALNNPSVRLLIWLILLPAFFA